MKTNIFYLVIVSFISPIITFSQSPSRDRRQKDAYDIPLLQDKLPHEHLLPEKYPLDELRDDELTDEEGLSHRRHFEDLERNPVDRFDKRKPSDYPKLLSVRNSI